MVQSLLVHQCEICRTRYDDPAEAHVCEARGIRTLENDPQPGDVVLCGRYGWWRGDPAWVSMGTGHPFHGVPMNEPRMVVTDRRLRRPTYGPASGHVVEYIMYTPSYASGGDQVLMTSPDHIPARMVGRATPEDLSLYREAAARILSQYSPRLA